MDNTANSRLSPGTFISFSAYNAAKETVSLHPRATYHNDIQRKLPLWALGTAFLDPRKVPIGTLRDFHGYCLRQSHCLFPTHIRVKAETVFWLSMQVFLKGPSLAIPDFRDLP